MSLTCPGFFECPVHDCLRGFSHRAYLLQFFGAGGWETILLAHSDWLDGATLAARLNSASYMPTPASPRYAAMMAELQALFATTAVDGRVRMDFETRILLGEIGA